MRATSRRAAYAVAFVLVVASALPAGAMAASPHFAFATATMSAPTIVAPGNIKWNTSLVVSFQVAGLSNNLKPTATIASSFGLNVNQSGVNNTIDIEQSVANPIASFVNITTQATNGGTNNNTINVAGVDVEASNSTTTAVMNLTQTGTGTGANAVTQTYQGISPTLTSQKNGQLTGALTIPAEVDASSDGSECVQMSWSGITLTVGGLTANLPTVSNQYDSTGSACAS